MKVGRIVASVTIENAADHSKTLRCDALVDTGASVMVLPSAWKDRLGNFESSTEIEVVTATQESVTAEVCGPVRIQIEGFRPIFNEVAFVEMNPADGDCEPLVGYIVLEQSQAAVDMLGHRLVPVKHMDLKVVSRVPAEQRVQPSSEKTRRSTKAPEITRTKGSVSCRLV